jgi:hypothetical protein
MDVGADSVLADWSQITRFFSVLATESPYVRVDTVGRSTLGRPLVLATITAPRHQQRLDRIREGQAMLADPRELSAATEDSLMRVQPAVVFINNNLHSTEIASSQFAMLLAHRLATRTHYQELLEDLVVLLTPSANPDGLDTVVAWYREHRGTPFEAGPLPWLYHAYAGHDNNRDWFMLTQVETRALTHVLYREWFPEVVWDVHQMGRNGARLFLPPFSDPVNPNIDPMLVSAMNLVGTAMAARVADEGRTGVEHGRSFDLWWQGGFRTTPARHNMIGILSEAASAKLASPADVPLGADRPGTGGVMYPSPWTGGRWGLPEIIDYELLAADGLVRLVSTQREAFLRRFVTLGRRAIAAGRAGGPFAYLVPPDQSDPYAVEALVDLMRAGGVEVQQAEAAFVADGETYPEGTVIIPMAQPFRAHAKDLLEVQHYPDRRAYEGGPPLAPYDATGWTLPLQFGLEVRAIVEPFDVATVPIDHAPPVPGRVRGSGTQFVLRNRGIAESEAIVTALQMGAHAWIFSDPTDIDGTPIAPGAVVLEGEPAALGRVLGARAREDGFTVWATEGLPAPAATVERLPRIGLYRSWVANSDEGWTRWVLEHHAIPYVSLTDSLIRAGDLRSVDVLVLPSLRPSTISGGHSAGRAPARYTGGLGSKGAQEIDAFVRGGGTLVAMGASTDYVMQTFDLPIQRIGEGTSGDGRSEGLYAPGTIFQARFRYGDPVTSGLDTLVAVFFSGTSAFAAGDGIDVLGRYVTNPLRSGYVLNPGYLEESPALMRAPVGKGRVILFGFRPQHRAQTLGTFKLLFNALLLSELR